MIKLKAVFVDLKEGILTPIYKKGDPSDPGNYREVLEHVLNTRHNKILEETKSRLQKEFTSVCSSVNAALILSEYVLESKNNKQELLLTALDRHEQNAFDVVDVVDHNFLLRRLYLDGIEGDDWLLILDLYSDCSSRVKWAGLMSDTINIKQGVRQGGVLSTSQYNRYSNPLLLQLEDRYSDVKIGFTKYSPYDCGRRLASVSQKVL